MLLQRQGPPSQDRAGRWGLPNAAWRSDETPEGRALRIAQTIGVPPGRLRMRGERVDRQRADRRCTTTVIADVSAPLPGQAGRVDAELAWVPEPEVVARDLHPAFAARWPALQAPETGLLVDAANVVGSRPDGWWRDRAGAAERLLRDIAAAAPGVLAVSADLVRWVTRPVVVLEGAAKRAPDVPGLEVIRAPGSGDDTIVDVARRGGEWVVVTADRGLRSRLPSGARPVGPSTLRSWLSPAAGGWLPPERRRRGDAQ